MNAYYPDLPGFRNTDTSIAMADAMAKCSSQLQHTALTAIREAGERGLTSEEISARTAIDFESIQPRTSELRRKCLIEDSGIRRLNKRGNRTIVWVAVTNAEGSI